MTVSQQNRIGLDQYLDMQGLTFQLKSHKTKPVDTEKMYENLMTRIGPESWSTNFLNDEFYAYEDKGASKNIEKDGQYLKWSKKYSQVICFVI